MKIKCIDVSGLTAAIHFEKGGEKVKGEDEFMEWAEKSGRGSVYILGTRTGPSITISRGERGRP
ncbi:MAG: hypothetical protein WCX17_04695 [Parcubacteria group bacterium]|jgi:hypothetical protein